MCDHQQTIVARPCDQIFRILSGSMQLYTSPGHGRQRQALLEAIIACHLYEDVQRAHDARAGVGHRSVHVSALHLRVRVAAEHHVHPPLRLAVRDEQIRGYE